MWALVVARGGKLVCHDFVILLTSGTATRRRTCLDLIAEPFVVAARFGVRGGRRKTWEEGGGERRAREGRQERIGRERSLVVFKFFFERSPGTGRTFPL